MSELHALVDFALCVVLWLVQLVIYPRFLRIDACELIAWHKAYVFRFSCVIIPLIVTQFICASFAVVTSGTLRSWVVLSLVLACLVLSFAVSVPLHKKIDQGDPTKEYRRKLIQTNWPRTILWTAIFLIGFLGGS